MARRYTREEKERAKGALVASALACGGSPDYRRVAQAEGVPYSTLTSWWHNMGEDERGRIRTASTHATAPTWKEGGQRWFETMQATLREKVDGIMARDWETADLTDCARAVETLARVLRDHRQSMGLTEEEPEDLIDVSDPTAILELLIAIPAPYLAEALRLKQAEGEA